MIKFLDYFYQKILCFLRSMLNDEYCDDDACYNRKPCLLHIPPPPPYSMNNEFVESQILLQDQPPPYKEEPSDEQLTFKSKFIFSQLEEHKYIASIKCDHLRPMKIQGISKEILLREKHRLQKKSRWSYINSIK